MFVQLIGSDYTSYRRLLVKKVGELKTTELINEWYKKANRLGFVQRGHKTCDDYVLAILKNAIVVN